MQEAHGLRRNRFKRKSVVIGALSFCALVLSTYYLNRPPDWTKTEPGKALIQARSLGSASALRSVIAKYPNTPAARAATAELPSTLLKEGNRTQSSTAYRDLLRDYPDSKEAAEAKAALPGALLSEARRRNLVAGFRTLIQEFPDSEESALAQTGIHNLYNESLNRYRARAGSAANHIDFMERLANYLEVNGPRIDVRYITFKGRKKEFADYEPASWDSEVVLDGLRKLFADFEGGTVELEAGEALDEPLTISRPTVAVEYVKRMNDSMYNSKGGEFAVGDDVTIKLFLRIPGEPSTVELAGAGRTPAHFTAPKNEAFTMTSKLAIEAALNKICAQFVPANSVRRGTKRLN